AGKRPRPPSPRPRSPGAAGSGSRSASDPIVRAPTVWSDRSVPPLRPRSLADEADAGAHGLAIGVVVAVLAGGAPGRASGPSTVDVGLQPVPAAVGAVPRRALPLAALAALPADHATRRVGYRRLHG